MCFTPEQGAFFGLVWLHHNFPGFYLGFILGGEVDPEKNFRATRRREKMFLGLLGGSGGMLPRKILKI